MIHINNKNYYEVGKPENQERTKNRLTELSKINMIELSNSQFGIKGIMSGLYIEYIWTYSQKQWDDYVNWVKKLIETNNKNNYLLWVNKRILVNTNKKINEPKIGEVVYFQPWMGKNANRKKSYPVLIKSGCYLDAMFHNVSNYWTWQHLTPTGRPKGDIEQGYGNFTIAKGWKVEIKVVVMK